MEAAELLGISPRVMNYKIKILNIEIPRGQADRAERSAHRPRHERRAGVAEVARGHDHVERLSVLGLEMRGGVRVVGRLRQQPAETDAVGRTQRHPCAQRLVRQRLLGQALAVVEAAVDAVRGDVVAPALQAMRLSRRDPGGAPRP